MNNQFNPMAGFITDQWSGQSGGYSVPGVNPVTQFDLGGMASSYTPKLAGITPDRSFMDGLLGGKNPDGTSFNGWGGMAMGALQGLGSAYMGMKQYGLAKDQLAFSKSAFERNFNAQKTLTNSSLEDRQRARVASNPGAYQSVGEYMSKNGVQ